ncbi:MULTISPECIES: hypothetical protein [Streptomyces]|uniref:hypothetical protein n=1 Tax=Streptomyces TaxID=1883 RepID=UPI001D177173|nr:MULTISPECIES: hypothetical protein [Streptomyces]MCX5037172.1 hypothetical protein [Streptomyces coelicoflavus]
MTQSGQGEEPSARQAREGIVLPSDGGEPLLPGLADTPVGPQAGGPPASAPPGGQAWDRPWGPEQQQGPPAGQGWPTPPAAQPWGAPETPQPSAWPPAQGDPGQAPGALPPQAGPGPLPPEGAQPPSYGAGDSSYGAGDPSYGAQPPYGHQQQHQQQHHQNQHPQQYGGAVAPLPAADEGATQFIPPVAASADEGATQFIPHIPPAGPGALPPESPAQAHAAESTQYLGQAPGYPAQPAPAPAPVPHPDAEATQYIAPVPSGPAGAPFGAAPGADEGRQPPAEFDNLFRGAPGADGPASATQQMPRFDAPQAPYPGDQARYAPQGPGGGGGGGRRRGGGDDGGRGGRGGRTGSRLPLIAAVGVGIAVVGVGAGAMMAGGGKDEDKGGNQPVSATAPASESASASASPSADPAEQQAVELDKLLAESGTGRTTVINAVGDVKTCDNLPQAAKDLREAAKQRSGLVDSLGKLSVDKLPRHTELTTALTKAWQASASADNHYAAWADRTAGKKGCKKGKAATQPSAANRASGTASKEKAKAAKLWNAIAKKYGLTERQPTQL